MEQVTAKYLCNPFDPISGVETLLFSEGTTIRNIADKFSGAEEFSRPTICVVNQMAVMRANWNTNLVKTDIVVFITVPQGDGSDPLKIILFITLIVIAGGYGLEFGELIGVSEATGSALIVLGGNLLINALIPPPQPPSVDSTASAASPTYTLQAQGNQARLQSPIPVLYGRHLIYPDFAAIPYAEFENNDQYLYQLFVIGQGEYEIGDLYSDVKVGETRIKTFTNDSESQVEIIQPGEPVTLVDTSVIQSGEVSGQELIGTNEIDPITIPDEDFNPYIGPFVIAATSDVSSEIAVDITLPRGLYFANNSGGFGSRTVSFEFQIQKINPDGSGSGQWITIITESISLSTNTPQRRTFKADTPLGRWQIRGRRTNEKDLNARAGNDLHWSGARAFLVKKLTFPGITLLAMKLKANDNISSQSSRKINIIAQRKLSICTGATKGVWNCSLPKPTSSIAWTLADICRNKTYGAGLEDHQIDLEGLLELDKTWTEHGNNGDTFNAIFDRKITLWEALTLVARCGRAVPIIKAGVISFIRDEEQEVISGMFSMNNIVENTLNISYVMPAGNISDSVNMEYIDNKIWKPKNVLIEYEPLFEVVKLTGEVILRFARVFADDDKKVYRLTITATSIYADKHTETSPTTITIQVGTRPAEDTITENNFYVSEDALANTEIGIITPPPRNADVVLVEYSISDDDQIYASQLPTTAKLFGCTNKEQAKREGTYLLNNNRHRRKSVTFQTELEGFVPTFGSLIAISHDMPSWGVSGTITGREGMIFQTSEELDFGEGNIEEAVGYVVGLRARDGSVIGPLKCVGIASNPKSFNLLPLDENSEALEGKEIDFDCNREPTHFAFGKTLEWSTRAKVKSVTPRGGLTVQITAVEDNPEVYTEESLAPYTPTNKQPIDLIISKDVTNYDVFAKAGYPEHPVSVTITVEAGVVVGSILSVLAALQIDGFSKSSEVRIINRGSIIGKGGDGGRNAVVRITRTSRGFENGLSVSPSSPGVKGGDAIFTSIPLTIDNAEGKIYGGGGGGGGGGAKGYDTYDIDSRFDGYTTINRPGGGGGAGIRIGLGGGGLPATEGLDEGGSPNGGAYAQAGLTGQSAGTYENYNHTNGEARTERPGIGGAAGKAIQTTPSKGITPPITWDSGYNPDNVKGAIV